MCGRGGGVVGWSCRWNRGLRCTRGCAAVDRRRRPAAVVAVRATGSTQLLKREKRERKQPQNKTKKKKTKKKKKKKPFDSHSAHSCCSSHLTTRRRPASSTPFPFTGVNPYTANLHFLVCLQGGGGAAGHVEGQAAVSTTQVAHTTMRSVCRRPKTPKRRLFTHNHPIWRKLLCVRRQCNQ